MAYIDIDIEDYVDEISTSILEGELKRRNSKNEKESDLITTQNGYQREFMRTVKEILESNVNLIEANSALQKLLNNE